MLRPRIKRPTQWEERARIRKIIFLLLITLLQELLLCAAQDLPEKKNSTKLRQGFESIGALAAGLAYSHLATTLNITQLKLQVVQAIDDIEWTVNTTIETLTNHSQNATAHVHRNWWKIEKRQAHRHLHTLDDLQVRLVPLRNETRDEHHKAKRQIAAAALLVGAGGFAFELFNEYKIQQITSRVSNLEDNFVHYVATETRVLQTLEENQKRIAIANQRMAEEIKEYRLYNWVKEIQYNLNHLLTEIDEKVRFTANVVYHLLQGQIYPPLFSRQLLTDTLTRMADKLAISDHSFIHNVVKDFYQFEVSFSHAGEGAYIILIHIPISSGGTLQLYRMLDTPFLNTKNLLFTLVPRRSILAISEDQTRSADMTPGQLAGCRHTQGLYYCDSVRIAYKDVESTCVGAAFTGRVDSMKKLCDVRIMKNGEAILPLNLTSFTILTTSKELQVKDSCQRVAQKIKSGDTVHMRPGCKAFTHHHWMYAAGDILSPTNIVHTPTTIDESIIDWTEFDYHDVAHEVSKIKNLGKTQSLLLADVKRRIKASRAANQQGALHKAFICLAALGVATILALACHIYWLSYKAHRKYSPLHQQDHRPKDQKRAHIHVSSPPPHPVEMVHVASPPSPLDSESDYPHWPEQDLVEAPEAKLPEGPPNVQEDPLIRKGSIRVIPVKVATK